MGKFLCLTVTFVFFIEGAPVLFPGFYPGSSVYAGGRYQVNPRLRKARARDALLQAMQANATVEIMLKQGSPDRAKMTQLLHASYGFQVKAISQIEGLVREASFKDPLLETGIKDMYNYGKPNTLAAQNSIARGDYDRALGYLRAARKAHEQFLTLTY